MTDTELIEAIRKRYTFDDTNAIFLELAKRAGVKLEPPGPECTCGYTGQSKQDIDHEDWCAVNTKQPKRDRFDEAAGHIRGDRITIAAALRAEAAKGEGKLERVRIFIDDILKESVTP